MLDETLAKLETNIRASDAIQADKKAELLRLLATLKSEIATLEHTHAEHAESVIGLAEKSMHEAIRQPKDPQLAASALQELAVSVAELEVSAPFPECPRARARQRRISVTFPRHCHRNRWKASAWMNPSKKQTITSPGARSPGKERSNHYEPSDSIPLNVWPPPGAIKSGFLALVITAVVFFTRWGDSSTIPAAGLIAITAMLRRSRDHGSRPSNPSTQPLRLRPWSASPGVA